MKFRVFSMSLFVASCTFGGSDEDPTNGQKPFDGGAVIDAASMDSTLPPAVDAAQDSSARDSGGGVDAALSCSPMPAPAVCDPVKNTGCLPLVQQCEIDPAAKTPAGRCTSGTIGLGDTCTSDAFGTTCAAPESCVSGKCRKACYCDADCDMGKKCSDTAPGPAGPIKLCAP